MNNDQAPVMSGGLRTTLEVLWSQTPKADRMTFVEELRRFMCDAFCAAIWDDHIAGRPLSSPLHR